MTRQLKLRANQIKRERSELPQIARQVQRPLCGNVSDFTDAHDGRKGNGSRPAAQTGDAERDDERSDLMTNRIQRDAYACLT
jgi:hypothetical protein